MFVGRVRDHDGGKGVDRPRLHRPPHRRWTGCGRCATRWPAATTSTRVARRCTGSATLAIGDLAVVVGTASAHRDAAFDATRDLIDTLKDEVPIWKHQRFGDGTEEWVGTP